ncbi:MAG: MFS transporter [Candidatus Micrarchaeota archaeon]|nr:MFS transporter [Candidatus Micrarchaeota archaeon]
MKQAKNGKDKKSNVLWLGIVSMLTDASSEMIAAVMPLFLANVLGASGFIIGLIEGIAKAAERLLSFLFGWYSDKIGKRKPVIAVGYLLSSLMKGAFAFTATWPEFLAARTIERTGKAIRDAPRDALLASSVGKTIEERRAGFALHRMLDTLGAILGPLIALLFVAALTVDFENTVRNLFIISLIPGLLGVIVILIFVKDVELRKPERNHKSIGQSFSLEYGDRFKRLLFSLAPFFLFAPPIAFIYLQASKVGLVLSGVITLSLIYSIFYLIGTSILNFISQKFNLKITKEQGIRFSLLLVAISFLLVFFVQLFEFQKSDNMLSFMIFGFALILYSIGMGMFEVESKSYISFLVKKKEMGGAFGAYQTVTGVMIIASGLVFGFLWDISPLLSFFISGFAALISFILLKAEVNQ